MAIFCSWISLSSCSTKFGLDCTSRNVSTEIETHWDPVHIDKDETWGIVEHMMSTEVAHYLLPFVGPTRLRSRGDTDDV